MTNTLLEQVPAGEGRHAMRILFLGGIFSPAQTAFIQSNSKGVVQNAADALQKNIIRGLVENDVKSLTIVNLPFIGAYPRGFIRSSFPSTHETIHDGVRVEGQGFSLRRVVKSLSRMVGAFKGLRSAAPDKRHIVLIYSAHLPFITAALAHRAIHRQAKVVLVVPDLPEFMGEGGWKYKLVKGIESRIFYALSRHIDGFVFLTAAMAERLRVKPGTFTVVEGIAGLLSEQSSVTPSAGIVFLYTGTLARRYGIMDLVNSFGEVASPDAELWICGDGDTRDDILAASSRDPRVKYFGQVSRERALELQGQATVLVNPRRPTEEFTKYSFPSKTMEYMASGRPVLMYPLPAMPPEYLPHFFPLDATRPDALKVALNQLSSADRRILDDKGKKAREFVTEQKNARVQSGKILALAMTL